MESLHFIRPQWFVALPVVLLWAVLLWRSQRGNGGWARMVDAHLRVAMLTGQGATSRWPSLLLAVLGTVVVVALAGPSWQRSDVPTQRDGRARVFVLDMSLSMNATDLSPNRFVQARLKLLDLLEQSQDRPVALIGFAAYPYTLAPLTDDTRTLQLMAAALETNMAPAQGADTVAAMQRGADILEQAFVERGELIVISDSDPGEAAQALAMELAAEGISTSVVSVGGDGEVTVPHGRGTVRDAAGQDVLVAPAHTTLRELARAGDGRFVALKSGAVSVDQLLVEPVGDASFSDNTGVTVLWRDDGAWLLWLSLLPLAALCRKGVLW